MVDEIQKSKILNRIKSIEENMAKAHEYLESGKHAYWHGFRPILKDKNRNGKSVPPHKDWIKNVFIPNQEKALKKAEKVLDEFD